MELTLGNGTEFKMNINDLLNHENYGTRSQSSSSASQGPQSSNVSTTVPKIIKLEFINHFYYTAYNHEYPDRYCNVRLNYLETAISRALNAADNLFSQPQYRYLCKHHLNGTKRL